MMKRSSRAARAAIFLGFCAPPAAMGAAFAPVAAQAAPAAFPVAESEAAAARRLKALLDDLKPQQGTVRLPAAGVMLTLGDDYYYLSAPEAKRVLTEGWGNPPEAVEDVLGMVFPAGKTFLDDVWGAVLTFEASGHVDDSDAREIDYDALLESMQEASRRQNAERLQRGLPTQTLVGWAQPPTYDPLRKSLIWARDIRFGGAAADTLNYDVRLLGRRGVFSLNMVAGMKDLQTVRTAAAAFGRAVSFVPGERYADFDDATDRKADYGLAGLVAAGAGAAAAKKVGLLALLAGLGKKLFVLIAVAFGALMSGLRRLFGRRGAD